MLKQNISYEELVELYGNNSWGLHTLIDMKDCDPDKVRSEEDIRTFVKELCTLIDMKRYGDTQVVNFGEEERVAGFSMTQLIETSLISGHFVNLTNDIFLDIFSCKLYNPNKAIKFATEYFKAKSFTHSLAIRGKEERI